MGRLALPLLLVACGPTGMGPPDPPPACAPPAESRLGVNAYHLVRAVLGRADGDLDAALGEAALVGAGAVRLWAFDDPRPPGWGQALDQVLDGVAARGMRSVATLSNQWADYGGAPGYLQRAGRDPGNLRAFFTDPDLEAAWRADVRAVVEPRAGRPDLLAWELINEPRCAGCDPAVVGTWLTRQRQFVQLLDPDTPVWAGDEGWAAGDGMGLDSVGSLHAYPRREVSASGADALAHGRRRIAAAAARARAADRPWIVGEIGWRFEGCPGADPDCSRDDEHLEENDHEKAVALGALLGEAARQGADWAFVWRLAEPQAGDGDRLAVTPSRMPRTAATLCEAAHSLGPG